MEASGWRLKGCGELKRGLKNYQQGRAGIRVTLPRQLALTRKQDDGELGASERARERKGDEAEMRKGSVKPEPLRSLGTFFSV